MSFRNTLEIVIYILTLISLTPLLGGYIAKVFLNQKNILTRPLKIIEIWLYKVLKIDENEEMDWKKYLLSLLIFNVIGFFVIFILQLIQGYLPLNPQSLPNLSYHLSFNTAASFITNTNWQSYAGETTMSYLTQMVGLTVQNFLSAATGITVVLALIRGITRKSGLTLGNFWSDMIKSNLYILLPLSIIFSVVLISQGVVQNFDSYQDIHTLEGTTQIIPQGPAASQIAIKQLGSNGGGFFNTNSAFPFENPTPLSNFLQCMALLLIPASLTYTYGKMTGSVKQGWAIFTAMMMIFLITLGISLYAEYAYNPSLDMSGIMEGKETRFGITNSVLWANATTCASNGAINAMHSSLSPLTGMIAMLNIMLGEVVFGGVGSGLYGILLFVILTVFITGLMVGRTPEYLGKKIQAFEIKMAILAIIIPNFLILIFTSIALITQQGKEGIFNTGTHGFTEVLYAFTSAAGNNGSAFAGLSANTPFYNLLLGITMLGGRFGVIIPVLAIAGSLVQKKISPSSNGTFQTDNTFFAILLVLVIVIVGALTFFPSLSLGPILEHLLMQSGKLI